jgi:hypothetical protein
MRTGLSILSIVDSCRLSHIRIAMAGLQLAITTGYSQRYLGNLAIDASAASAD